MKKYLPFILLGAGVLVIVIAFVFVKFRHKNEIPVDEEEAVAEIPFDKRPYASLTPTEDGHYLNLEVSNVTLDAATMEYELLYKTQNGLTQGVPGEFELKGQISYTADLLLGSESSGKFRYDEGVKEGTISLKFRNDKGKLVGKLLGEFRLYSGEDVLASADNKFEFDLSDYDEQYFVVMDTFGLPKSYDGSVSAGPVGVFASDDKAMGEPKFETDGKVMEYVNGSWNDVSGDTQTGVFIVASGAMPEN
jgi:hypothetical protein